MFWFRISVHCAVTPIRISTVKKARGGRMIRFTYYILITMIGNIVVTFIFYKLYNCNHYSFLFVIKILTLYIIILYTMSISQSPIVNKSTMSIAYRSCNFDVVVISGNCLYCVFKRRLMTNIIKLLSVHCTFEKIRGYV